MGGARDITEVDSTLSTRDLMQRKLFLMKMMLKNEKNANNAIKTKLSEMDQELHTGNITVNKYEESRLDR